MITFSGSHGTFGANYLFNQQKLLKQPQQSSTVIHFGAGTKEETAQQAAPRKKASWPVTAMMTAWLSTLGLGGFLGYQQYETNQDLLSRNQALSGQLDETNNRFASYATGQELNGLQQEMSRRTAELNGRLDTMGRNLVEADTSLSQIQSFLNRIQAESGQRLEDMNGLIDSLRGNLGELRNDVNGINRLVITPEAIRNVMPATAKVVANAEGRTVGSGSGVWIRDGRTGDVFLLTNHHVVSNEEISFRPGLPPVPVSYAIIQNGSETEIPATVVHKYEALDLALLAVDRVPPGVRIVTLRDMEREPLQQGEKVFTVGAPSGFQDNVTTGIISHTNRLRPDMPGMAYVQTDAPINPGNSGGGLFDSQGRLVGINNMVIRRMPATTDGLGFSIRVDVVKDYMNRWPALLAQELEEKARQEAEAEARRQAEAEAEARRQAEEEQRRQQEASPPADSAPKTPDEVPAPQPRPDTNTQE